jgi:hypothetical protein
VEKIKTAGTELAKFVITLVVTLVTVSNFFVTSKEFGQHEKVEVAVTTAQAQQNEDIKKWLERVEKKLDGVLTMKSVNYSAPSTKINGSRARMDYTTGSEYVVHVSGRIASQRMEGSQSL